jgi:Methyltransferase FkbM domain
LRIIEQQRADKAISVRGLFKKSRSSFGNRGKDDDAADFEQVPARTLDTLASELSIEQLDLIKIDVAGAEPLVLEGAQKTLSKFTPAILFESNPSALAALGLQYDSSWKILADLAYRFYELRSDRLKEVSQCPGEMKNLWAVHPSKPLEVVEVGPSID